MCLLNLIFVIHSVWKEVILDVSLIEFGYNVLFELPGNSKIGMDSFLWRAVGDLGIRNVKGPSRIGLI